MLEEFPAFDDLQPPKTEKRNGKHGSQCLHGLSEMVQIMSLRGPI